jgi:hypothetical protein
VLAPVLGFILAPVVGFIPALVLGFILAPVVGFMLAPVLGIVMTTSMEKARGNALLQLLQLEIQMFHRFTSFLSGIFTREKNLIVLLRSLELCKPRQSKVHP